MIVERNDRLGRESGLPDRSCGITTVDADWDEKTVRLETRTLTAIDDVIPIRPIRDRVIDDIDDTAWGMSRLLMSDPSKIDDPEITEKAKIEMMEYNARIQKKNRSDGKVETGKSIAEIFASFGAMRDKTADPEALSFSFPESDPLDPITPNWAIPVPPPISTEPIFRGRVAWV